MRHEIGKWSELRAWLAKAVGGAYGPDLYIQRWQADLLLCPPHPYGSDFPLNVFFFGTEVYAKVKSLVPNHLVEYTQYRIDTMMRMIMYARAMVLRSTDAGILLAAREELKTDSFTDLRTTR